MTPPDLPAELKAALARKNHGLPQTDTARRVSSQSRTYRAGGSSRDIKTAHDALAYALARMPATYAAVVASLNSVAEMRPNFAPATMLDVGAGPGTATWAASETFSTLNAIALLDSNRALQALAIDLMQGTLLSGRADYAIGDANALLARAPSADVVVASYVLAEIQDGERPLFAERLWDRTGEILLVVEPGTPAGYQRIVALRTQLIGKNAHVIAPCPHDGACPLVGPDWCHFSQRLPRSRAHKHLKGANLPFEDERFSYIALSRIPPANHLPRVLAQPAVSKGAVTLKLCAPGGLRSESIPRQHKAAYQNAKKLRWGDVASGPLDGASD